MEAAEDPFTSEVVVSLPLLGQGFDIPSFTKSNVTMESYKYICVQLNCPRTDVLKTFMIVDMENRSKPVLSILDIDADYVLVNPNSLIAVKGPQAGRLEIIDWEKSIKSYKMDDQVVFWKWITAGILGVVTQTSVYHWSSEGDSKPVKMFDRVADLENIEIVDYKCDPSQQWLVLIGIAHDAVERGNMQLFSVKQKNSRVIEAHAAAFAQFKHIYNAHPFLLLCFATRIHNAGQITSKLHIIELAARAEQLPFKEKESEMLFPPNSEDFPVAVEISQKNNLIYIVTKIGFLFLYDLETGKFICSRKFSECPILVTAPSEDLSGFYSINRDGEVLWTTVNQATIGQVIDKSFRSPFLSTAQYADLAIGLLKLARPMYSHYIVEKALGSCRILTAMLPNCNRRSPPFIQDWLHVSFIARPETPDESEEDKSEEDESEEDKSEEDESEEDENVLFFIELLDAGFGDGMTLNLYAMAKPNGSGITDGCSFCPKDRQHPHIWGVYFAGQWSSPHTINSSSQKELAELFRRQPISSRKLELTKKQKTSGMRPEFALPDPSCFCPVLPEDEYCELALQYITKAEGVSYVYSAHSCTSRWRSTIPLTGYGVWVHVMFTAYRKYPETRRSFTIRPAWDESEEDPRAPDLRFFFAELNDPGIGKLSLTAYKQMKFAVSFSGGGLRRGCEFCPVGAMNSHPKDVPYLAGHGEHRRCREEVKANCELCRRP